MEGITNLSMGDADITARSAAGRSRAGTQDRTVLIVGAWLAVLGALLAFVANGLHPHPSDFRLESLLQQIAENGAWSTVHMTLIFGLLLILGALVAITFTFESKPGATAARFACVASLMGGALIMVSTAMDGFAMNRLASAWLDAAPGDKATVLGIASAFEDAQYAVYSLSIVIFLGIGIFLYGLATVQSATYPKALGWLAMLSGGGSFVVGVAQSFGGPDLRTTEIFFVLFSMSSTVWVLVMGVLMWRRARQTQAHRDLVPVPS
jgi:hypothetical protein